MSTIHRLHQLANLYGLQTAYYDVHRRRQPASAESLLALLSCLGAPVASLKDVVPAWRQRRQELWQRMLEPVTLAWEGRPPPVRIRLPAASDSALSCHLKLEDGTERSWRVGADTPVEAAEVEGTRYVVRQLALPRRLPRGYHRLTLETGGKLGEGLIISAPKRAYQAEMTAWGPFLPLYALYTGRSRGSGDYSDMAALAAWAAGFGAQVIATLPLLATFADRADSSPYLPVSRRLWNEFYIALDRVPELSRCPAAQALMESSSFRDEAESLSRLPLVDYSRQMALKRQVLSELCRCLYREPSPRLEELQHFAGSNPVAGDYACFRAADEKKRVPWSGGKPGPGDYDEDSRRYYLYAQWLAHQQMAELAARVKGSGLRLYLDLPLGVHPGGYDVWSQRDLFINGASAGAPPDIVFTRGQDWAFPPLHPERIREQGYEYVLAYLRHHLRHAGILRLDHVMGLHHLFCIPREWGPARGYICATRPRSSTPS